MSEIAEPGVYDRVPMIEYLRDPVTDGSISASGIGEILKAPARFRAWADAPLDSIERGRSDAMDFGTLAHAIVLDTDDTFEEVPGVDNWQTKAAQAARKAIEADGRVAVLPKHAARARELAETIREHPVAGPLLTSPGRSEQTLVWIDDETGVFCRARIDRLPDVQFGERLIVPDLKTTESAHPDACDQSIARYGYGRQGWHYRAGLIALDVDPDPAMVVVFVETRRPYLITVRQLGMLGGAPGVPGPLAIGRRQVRAGLRLFAECQASGQWPGYGERIEFANTPSWAAWEDRQADYGGE